ncbi:MAG: type IX secretion system outer membrane channel protein PorV [Salinivirgaceae bacterium]|jgi:hypothetical protein
MTVKNLLFLTLFLLCNQLFAQHIDSVDVSGKHLRYNPVRHAVPFLTISPDSRSSGMGDVGAATSPDIYSVNWNVGKLANIEGKTGIALGYTPWLKRLVKDIHLSYLTGYYRLDENQVFGGSLRYFSLGQVVFRDNTGQEITVFIPNEFAFDGAYSRKLGTSFSMGLAARYIFSNLTGTLSSGTDVLKPAHAFAVDLGSYYHTKLDVGDIPSVVTAGLAFTNIGTKVTYSANNKYFLPMNLRLGGGLAMELDDYNKLSLYADLNKLMVPTHADSIGSGSNTISVPVAIFKSFSDAPGVNGSVFREEMQEIMISVGVEYVYSKLFAVRAGYFHEHERKGNRKYVTAGAGLKFNALGIDLSYLIPVIAHHPLSQTIRFSLVLDIGAMSN